jgi:cytochrome c-type biogenesis protein CcmH
VTNTFWVAAAVLCLAAVAMLFVPLWREKRRGGRWSPLGLIATVAIAPAAAGLYFVISDWDFEIAERALQGDRLVAALAARLEQTPDDLAGWRLLADSYMTLGRFDQGLAAYRHVWTRTSPPDDELTLAYAEAQILADRGALTGEAGQLVESVLTRRPTEPKALWYGGHFALAQGQAEVARARWTALLGFDLPDEVAATVRSQLAALGGASASAPSSPAVAADALGPAITLSVSLGAGRSVAELGANAQLFIFARAPEGGPPLAVLRHPAAAVPGQFTLSDANSMIPGRSLASYPQITVVARLSASGQPLEQSGDWFAQASVRPSEGGIVALVIDQTVP